MAIGSYKWKACGTIPRLTPLLGLESLHISFLEVIAVRVSFVKALEFVVGEVHPSWAIIGRWSLLSMSTK